MIPVRDPGGTKAARIVMPFPQDRNPSARN